MAVPRGNDCSRGARGGVFGVRGQTSPATTFIVNPTADAGDQTPGDGSGFTVVLQIWDDFPRRF